MPKQSVTYLKSRFVTGVTPNQTDYSDWLDSYVHKDDLGTLNNQTIDARISTYDSELRSRNINNSIDSLGDVFHFLDGFDDESTLAEVLSGIGGAPTWATIQQKPASVSVTWDVQVVSLDSYAPGPPNSIENVPSVSVSSFGSGALLQQASRYLVRDLVFSRIAYVPSASNLPSYYADRLRSVVYAVSPKISLT